MDKTARSLAALIGTSDTTLRVAAIQVVAALDLRDRTIVRAIGASLKSDDEPVQVHALRALAQLGPADAMHLVAPKLLASGAVRQQASQVLTLAGPAAIPELRRLWPKADYHGRRTIASTLAAIGGGGAFTPLVRAMPAEDLEMIKHLTACARQVLERLPAAGRLAAVRELRSFLRQQKTLRNPHAVIAGLILLGGISDPKAVAEAQTLLLAYLDRKQPEPVRRNAAVSLGRLPLVPRATALLVPKLLPFLEEADWSPVVQNVLPIVQRLEMPRPMTAKLLPLLRRSPHVAVQVHVLERLRGEDRPAIVQEVVLFLQSPHPRLRDAAEAALKSMPSAAEALLGTWAGTPDEDLARRIEGILHGMPEPVRKRLAAQAADRLLAAHEKEDPRWRRLLEFVRAHDAASLQKRATARLTALRSSRAAKSRAGTERLLQLLWEQNLATPAQRLQYGLLLLGRSRKDLARPFRDADPALRLLGGLARGEGARFTQDLRREPTLGAEECYYLGFHWSESGEELRPLGLAMLAHVVERWPRHKLRRAAQHKIELQSTPAAHVVDK
jgi:hypothetical protein